jgi:enoyl-CoA hydratase/carnithine racemase
MRATFEEYCLRYADFAQIHRDEQGLLEVRLHREQGPIVFDGAIHAQLPNLFADVGSDPENRVILLTGTGDRFMLSGDMDMSVMEQFLPYTPAMHSHTLPESARLIQNFLDIEVPVIAAINGPVTVHAEIPVLADIVLASEDCYFADSFHFQNGVIPGDGAQVIWPMMIGLNRARYFLLTAERISAEEGRRLGFVNEVLARSILMPRARQLASLLLAQPDVTLRGTRQLFTRTLKRAITEDLPFGLAIEGLGNIHHWPLTLRD